MKNKPHSSKFEPDDDFSEDTYQQTAMAEEELIGSKRLYRTVLETVNDGIILQAASGEILTWNKAAEKVPAKSISDSSFLSLPLS